MTASPGLVGRTLGEFVLREQIGEGGFGAVYRAIQPALDRDAVVKVLHAQLSTSRIATDRFLREAKLASKLDHPYAAHVYAFGAEADGPLWIAMERVRGTPLDKVLRSQGPISLERFIPLLERICEVVHTAHEQGIIHRDLKPANVMVLSRAGRLLPKLLDFGIAKGLFAGPGEVGIGATLPGKLDQPVDGDTLQLQASESQEPNNLTMRGAVMGSPHYMAPEQWVDAGDVDARTDLYALGVLAYECLIGRPPFGGQTITAIAQAHANDAVPALGAGFPPALDAVFAKVLAKDPGARYGDALSLAAAMRAASGLALESKVPLPEIDAALVKAAIAEAPQPIAEALAGYEAARNPHQGRDALALVGRTLARYLGLLALLCRARVAGEITGAEAIRAAYRRTLTDREWLELAVASTRSWRDRRDAYPIPELVTALHDTPVVAQLEVLFALREAEGPARLAEQLEAAAAATGLALAALDFLRDYALVVVSGGAYAESWMGARRTQRTTLAVHGRSVRPGAPALLDHDGVPVLALDPLFALAAPTPGAPLELFLFDGRDRRGAKFVSLPSGFEHHDDAVWDWFRAQLVDSLDDATANDAVEKMPYRGLAAFSADDSALFIGRERQVDAFVNRLKLTPLLAVVGRSGAGKSSFVHAGVVPALGWRTISLRPGPAPMASLSARLEHAGIAGVDAIRADAAARGPVLLVVDQLEELFTLGAPPDEQRAFAETLVAIARAAEDPVRVVVTLRDDFLVRAEQIAALRNRIGQGLQLLTVPAAEDLARIIVEPARRAGYELEGALASEIVADVADQPGALALISFTASKLWELRDRQFKQLTRSAYQRIGGVGGALAQHAERTLDEMLPEERALTRGAFRHLVTSQSTRAVVARRELRQLLGGSDHAESVIEKLVAARLLATNESDAGDETVEVVHEALIVSWPRLVEWRREDSEGTRFREQLRSAAGQWHERGRPTGLLWRGDALAELARWRGKHNAPLTDVEAAFADASTADAARGRRRLRFAIAAAFGVLAAALVALALLNNRANDQRSRAEASAREVNDNLQRTDEDQGRRHLLANEPLLALAYLDKARELGAHGAVHDLLVAEALEQSSGELVEMRAGDNLMDARFSPDGGRILARGHQMIGVWDARSGKPLLQLPRGPVEPAAGFTPDGAGIVVRDLDGVVERWDLASGAKRASYPPSPASFTLGNEIYVANDGKRLAIVDLATGAVRRELALPDVRTAVLGASDARLAVRLGGAIRILDTRSGEVVRELAVPDLAGEVRHPIAISRDDRRIAVVYGNALAVWDLASGARLVEITRAAPIVAFALDPTGERVAIAAADRSAELWRVDTGTTARTLGGQDKLSKIAFSADGARLVTASLDGSAWLRDAASGEVLARWTGHEDAIRTATFDPAGTRVATTGDDGRIVMWQVAPQQATTALTGARGEVYVAQFAASGQRVLTAGEDGVARIWTTDGALVRAFDRGAPLAGAALSADERRLATVTDDGALEIADAAGGGVLQRIANPATSVVAVAWSPDGRALAIAGYDGWLRCWDATRWTPRFAIHATRGRIFSVVFTPDGRSLLTAGDDGATRFWDLDGKQLSSRPDPASTGAAISPDGARVLNMQNRQRLQIWRVATGEDELALVGHTGFINDAQWSRDGAYIISTASDGTARIWETSHGDAVAILTPPDGKPASTAAFSPDGQRVVLAGADGRVAIYALPRFRGSADELARLLACRVPYEIADNRVVPRERRCAF